MAASTSPVIACARMSCQIGALSESEVHSIGERLTSISGSMFSPEQIIKLYGCVATRLSLREELNQRRQRIRSVRDTGAAAPLRREMPRRLPGRSTDPAY